MDLLEIMEKQNKLWQLVEKNRDDQEIKILLESLDNNYTELLNSNSNVEIRYEFMRFHLRYISTYKENSFNIFFSIYSHWKDTAENDDFPIDLLKSLLNVIKNNGIEFFDNRKIYRLADSLFDNGKYDLSKIYYQELEQELDNEDSWCNWAQYYQLEQDYQTALTILDKAKKKIPFSSLVLANRAFYLSQLDQNDAAINQLRTIIENEEINKFSDNNYYNYAIDLKAVTHEINGQPLHAFMERARQLTTYDANQQEIMESVKELFA